MKQLFLLFSLLFMLAGSLSLKGQTSLSDGELAIIGIDAAAEDFSFITFVDLAAGTEIYFTDEEANGTYTIGGGEGTELYTAPLGGVSAGTVISFGINSVNFTTTLDGSITLANGGDGLLAYQGGSLGEVTTFLHAVGESAAYIGTFPDGFSNTLILGQANGTYNGTRAGTAMALMSSINNSANWTLSSSSVLPFSTSAFTINLATEPSNHPTLFNAIANSNSQITITWADNDGAIAATGFFVMINTSGTFTDPVDGVVQMDDVDLSDDIGQVKVAHGTASYSWNTGLKVSTIYYFKVYAYAGVASSVNYKTDATVPTASATTDAHPKLMITEVADPSNNITARFVEIYNYGSVSISLADEMVYLSKQTNGGSWSNAFLNGTVGVNETYSISYSVSGFSDAYGFVSDENAGAAVNGNGNDAFFLYFDGDNSSGTLIDIYGVINEDGAGKAWEYTDSRAVRKLSVTAATSTWNSAEWVIHSADSTEMSPSFYGAAWFGTADNSWTNNANWDLDAPTSAQNALIKSSSTNFPTLSAAQSVVDLKVETGASIVGIENLTVAGSTTVQQQIDKYSGSSNGWNLISCATSGTDISSSNATSGNYDFYAFNEISNTWLNQEDVANDAAFATYTLGKGYLYANDANVLLSFSGVLNTGDVSISGLTKTEGFGNGWHILGNPYPSALTWGAWTSTNIGGVASVLKKDGTGFSTRSSGEYIPANQGFFVQVSAAPGSITIPVSACVHNAQAYSAKSSNNDLLLKLFVDTMRFVETRVMLNSNATDSFDWLYDANFLAPFDQALPKMFTYIDYDQHLSLNTFNLSGLKSIPLRIEVPVGASFQLSAEGIESFDTSIGISLEDTYTNTMYDLRLASSISINPSNTDAITRFVLHFNNLVLEESLPSANSEDDYTIYSYGNRINIQSLRSGGGLAKLEVYTLNGQLVYLNNINTSEFNSFILDLSTATYIIKITEGYSITTTKLLITK